MKSILLLAVVHSSASAAAFVARPSKTTTALQYAFHAPEEPVDRPLRRLTPDCVWVKETDQHRAVECAEGECSLDELESLIDVLKRDQDQEEEEDLALAKGREDVLRMLELKHELKSLEETLADNVFVNRVETEDTQEQWEGHWYEDYIHHGARDKLNPYW